MSTIQTYLSSVKVWHIFHAVEYPEESNKSVDLLLKESMKIEIFHKIKKQ